MPVFSIIIPAYNVEKYLKDALDSILAQTFQDWEAIIVDDGSTDGTNKIASSYCALDSRFSLIQQKNSGPGAARNAAVLNAKGMYFIFLDGDDLLYPNVLEKYNESIVSFHSPAIICSAGFVQFYDKDLTVEQLFKYPELPDKIMSGTAAFQWTILHHKCVLYGAVWTRCYHRRIFKNGDLFFLKKHLHEDEEWIPRAFFSADSVCFSNTCCIRYRIRAGSIMQTAQTVRIQDTILNIKKMLSFLSTCTFTIPQESSAFMDNIIFQYASFLIRSNYTLKDKFTALSLRKTENIAHLLSRSPYFPVKTRLGSRLYYLVHLIERLPFLLPVVHIAIKAVYSRR